MMAVSESQHGTPWPPAVSVEGKEESPVDDDSAESEGDETPDWYVPDHLAEYKVSLQHRVIETFTADLLQCSPGGKVLR